MLRKVGIMILRLRYFYLFLLIFIFSAQFYGQSVSEEDSAKLSFADDKRVYRIGEPIKLILAISVKPGTHLIADGVSLTEEFLLTPTDGALGLEQQKLRLYGNNDDSTGILENAPIPYNIPFFLNNFYRFDKPGKYSLKSKHSKDI